MRNYINSLRKKKYNYCIVDSEIQEDLRLVAEAVERIPILGGSSAIGEELLLSQKEIRNTKTLPAIDFLIKGCEHLRKIVI